ncbi:MAG: N(2)-fixation sustaining protein CowN [Leptolyngbyaceae cyanobacterium SM2_3_12]|nr:N(2)-fixation sustaining protein CowN [Leptolyngbyaceae cyanobacterium SM2_3_12]
MTKQNINRYISFKGIDCEGKARRILSHIEQYINKAPHPSSWTEYFYKKLQERTALGQDDLFFVSSQLNSIRALFEEYQDSDALDWLDQVEEECC